MKQTAEELTAATKKLLKQLSPLVFSHPVACTYNPLEYAFEAYELYLKKYAAGEKKVLFLGMNPGPFGMAQTGVPFGEVAAVRDWMGITASIGKPALEHPKRPVTGFDCPRSEVSGRRLWGLFAECFGTADAFFSDKFVANYCPLVWMSESGSNITPDKIPVKDRELVEQACLDYLSETLRILKPEILIGIGGYATKKLEQVVKKSPGQSFTIGTLLHPSPASPTTNKYWPELPKQQLRDLGILPQE